MIHTELMERIQSLPSEKQFEIFDFVEFLSTRYATKTGGKTASPEQAAQEEMTGEWSGPLAALRARIPRQRGNVQPMSRE